MQAELVFRGARLADGDNPVRTADVAVDGGRVTAVADRLPIDGAKEVVDASGLLLCPGFIDLHAHSALRPFRDPLLTAKVAQGFTTELICPDGLAPAPVTPVALPASGAFAGTRTQWANPTSTSTIELRNPMNATMA